MSIEKCYHSINISELIITASSAKITNHSLSTFLLIHFLIIDDVLEIAKSQLNRNFLCINLSECPARMYLKLNPDPPPSKKSSLENIYEWRTLMERKEHVIRLGSQRTSNGNKDISFKECSNSMPHEKCKKKCLRKCF